MGADRHNTNAIEMGEMINAQITKKFNNHFRL